MPAARAAADARACRRWSTGPTELREALGGHVYLGARRPRVRRPGDLAARSRRAAADRGARSASSGSRSVAVSSVFSPVNAEFELEAAELLAAELPGVAVSALARDRACRAARARERDDHERLPAVARRRHRRGLPLGAGPIRHRGPGLPEPERRHADERGVRGALPGGDVRLRTDELDARRGVPVRARRLRGRRHRRHDRRRRHAPARLPARGRGRRRYRRRAHELPDARRALARHRRRQPGAQGRRAARRPAERRLRADAARARVRRRRADRHRRRRRRRAARASATRSASPGSTTRSSSGALDEIERAHRARSSTG